MDKFDERSKFGQNDWAIQFPTHLLIDMFAGGNGGKEIIIRHEEDNTPQSSTGFSINTLIDPAVMGPTIKCFTRQFYWQ